jgi:hypothetical protein
VKDRIPCVVPFCRRTAAREHFPDATEIICYKCGRLAPRARKLWRALYRQAAKQGWRVSDRQHRRLDRVWESFKRAAILAAGATP